MSRTAELTWWDSNSNYHDLRKQDAAEQVRTFIIPRLLDACGGKSSIEICDFACGAGAIASEVVKQSGDHPRVSRINLIDVAPDNLLSAETLLKTDGAPCEIECLLVNGSEFPENSGSKADFLYCWDAMVHFDIIDIVGYLNTLHRVCSGFALFHHSNFTGQTVDIRQNPHWRNFMSKEIFWQLCNSCGHDVLSQQLLD